MLSKRSSIGSRNKDLSLIDHALSMALKNGRRLDLMRTVRIPLSFFSGHKNCDDKVTPETDTLS